MTSAADSPLVLPPGPEDEAPSMIRADGGAPEPGTPRALWPTFMRRTLAEDTLRAPQRPLPSRPLLPEG